MNTRLKIFLDDLRQAPNGWQLVKTADEAIKILKKGNVAEISLDHDLGDDESGTGYDVVLWIEREIIENGFIPPKIKVHSANISARTKMELGIQKIVQLANRKI